MSADNGIYILPIIYVSESTTFNKQSWTRYRVIEAGGIDNITFEPDREDGYNSEQLEQYFGDAPEFECEHEAILYAHKKAKEYAVLEYGVSHLLQTDYKFLNTAKHSPRIYGFDGGCFESTLWLIDKYGTNVAKVTRLKPVGECDEDFATTDEEWQKIIDTIVLAPEFIELAKEMNLALSADNKQEYDANELKDNLMQMQYKFSELMKKLKEEII